MFLCLLYVYLCKHIYAWPNDPKEIHYNINSSYLWLGKVRIGFFFPYAFYSHLSRALGTHACWAAQLCPTLRDPVNCSPPVLSVCGILQARILEWIAISSSRGSSWSRDQTQSPALQAHALLSELLGKPSFKKMLSYNLVVQNVKQTKTYNVINQNNS